MMNKQRWDNLMTYFGVQDDASMFDQLIEAYSESQRHYHNVSHIDYMLKIFDQHAILANNPQEVEFAILFHDIVYKIGAVDNELQSAKLAHQFLSIHSVNKFSIESIFNLIMATKHNVLLTDNDQRLLADIDLSILGESTKLFDQYETNIRKEYIAIPQEVYRTERIKVLQYFSRKEEIFYHRSFLNMYEKQAKKNLQKSIAKLHNETH